MRKIYFGDFRQYVLGHIKEIEKADIESYTTEWFLIRYLKKITKITAESYVENMRVEGSIRALIRFYIDNIDEKSQLGDRCQKIYNEYRAVLRKKQTSKFP